MQTYSQKKSILLVIFLVFIDQLSKYIIRTSRGFYICNAGISFGLKIPTALFYPIWSIVFLSLIHLFFKKYSKYSYAILLILAGSVSNLIDRLYNGCVIDFIDWKIWPIFNLADVFICLGFFLVVLNFSKK